MTSRASPITPSSPAARDSSCRFPSSGDDRLEPRLRVVAQQGDSGSGHGDRRSSRRASRTAAERHAAARRRPPAEQRDREIGGNDRGGLPEPDPLRRDAELDVVRARARPCSGRRRAQEGRDRARARGRRPLRQPSAMRSRISWRVTRRLPPHVARAGARDARRIARARRGRGARTRRGRGACVGSSTAAVLDVRFVGVRRLRCEAGDRVFFEESSKRLRASLDGASGDDAEPMPAPADLGDRPRERRNVVRCGLEVADEQDRPGRDLVALERRLRELERDRDPRARAERLRPRVLHRAESRCDEQSEQRPELVGGRARRQELVRRRPRRRRDRSRPPRRPGAEASRRIPA